MLPLTGYCARWSVRQGDELPFHISSRSGRPFRARVARVFCGDPNPRGPGYREEVVRTNVDGEHPGRDQSIRLGSWGEAEGLTLGGSDGFNLSATVWPTRPVGRQTVLSWIADDDSAEMSLAIGETGVVAEIRSGAGTVEISTGSAVVPRCWYDIGLTVTSREVVVWQRQRPQLHSAGSAVETSLRADIGGLGGRGRATFAASPAGGRNFNGKIERPTLWDGPVDASAAALWQASPGPVPAAAVAAWDFSVGIDTDEIRDIGPNGHHGRLFNLPTRAMTGSNWDGSVHRWVERPDHYGAIHFHDDDIGDAGWAETLRLAIPPNCPSGLYTLHIENEEGRDSIPFAVRAAVPGSQSKVALLLPTLTYQVYAQFAKPPRGDQIQERCRLWNALPHAADHHREYGLSPYNVHSDGSGISMASMLRPMVDKRLNQIHLVDESDIGSGTYWLSADTYLIDWLSRVHPDHEIITDHDVHAEGHALLARYDVVITGQHPEYHTDRTLGAIEHFLAHGGRFMYMGGNGFYWKIAPHRDGPWAVELRRAESGIRAWATEPGENYHAFDGSLGGLWRRIGKPPQSIVGVGFSSQGRYAGFPYTFTDAMDDPRVGFIRAALGDAAAPGSSFGERGLMGGGAAGHELDRADIALGTPRHALVIATAIVHDPSFEPVNEERLKTDWPASREALIRSDITFFETPSGGAVFSVGSMNYIGALPIDGYSSTAAKLARAVLDRFVDPTPFSAISR